VSDEFTQRQINDLQSGQAATQQRVEEAHKAASRNEFKLDALHRRVDDVEKEITTVKTQMLTAAQFEQMLEQSFNKQFVKGMKYVIGSCIAFVVAAWTDVVNWITR
jgi:chromosome segregation ATPase